MLDFRTDLADERTDLYKKANNIENKLDGIEVEEKQINKNIKVTRVNVINENGERALGKVKGNYVTIDMKNMKYMGEDEIQSASEILCKELKNMIDEYVNNEEEILVVGLGNIYVTPDALGPKVINEIDITRHLLKYVPQYLDKNTSPFADSLDGSSSAFTGTSTIPFSVSRPTDLTSTLYFASGSTLMKPKLSNSLSFSNEVDFTEYSPSPVISRYADGLGPGFAA